MADAITDIDAVRGKTAPDVDGAALASGSGASRGVRDLGGSEGALLDVDARTGKDNETPSKKPKPKPNSKANSKPKTAQATKRTPPRTITSLTLTPLGTASAQPSATRSQSALALSLEGRGEVWLVDCGEGTQGRVMASGAASAGAKVRMGRITKVFLTHLHGDHVFGLAPLLSTAMNGAGGSVDSEGDERDLGCGEELRTIEIYGPLHTRAFLRSAFTYTYTHLAGRYVVHELRFAHDGNGHGDDGDGLLPLHASELPSGRNVLQESDGTWRGVFEDEGMRVDAAPIVHSVPCVGYVFAEADVPGRVDAATLVPLVKRSGAPLSVLGQLQRGEDVRLPDGTRLAGVPHRPGRKVVVLGDTSDALGACPALAALAAGCDVLVHEATNSFLPGVRAERGGSRGKVGETGESVRVRAAGHGHSTPEVAGAVARRVGARRLVLNHFSARYAAPAFVSAGCGGDVVEEEEEEEEELRGVMESIRRLAVEAFGREEVVCARDLESVVIELN